MSQRYHEYHYVLGEFIHLTVSAELVSVSCCPHGHVCGVFSGSHPYLRCEPSLNSDLLREKLYFFKGSTLSQFDAPFCDATQVNR